MLEQTAGPVDLPKQEGKPSSDDTKLVKAIPVFKFFGKPLNKEQTGMLMGS